jgi:hypothetical protein
MPHFSFLDGQICSDKAELIAIAGLSFLCKVNSLMCPGGSFLLFLYCTLLISETKSAMWSLLSVFLVANPIFQTRPQQDQLVIDFEGK